MHLSFFGVSAVGTALEGVLLWRLLKLRGLSRYPFFTAFVLCDFVRSLSLIVVVSFWRSRFASVYWGSELPILLLRLTIVWEAVRHSFPEPSAVRRVAQGALFSAGVLVLSAMMTLSWSQASLIHFSYQFVPPVFEQYLSLSEAALLLAVGAIARYYGLRLGGNMRGLILGLALYLSLYSTNFASLQIIQGFFPYWRFLGAGLYISLLIFWLWAFWEYNPAPNQVTSHYDQALWKRRWANRWMTTMNEMRRGPN